MKQAIGIVAAILFIMLIVTCGEKMTEEQLYAQVLDYQEKQQWEDVVKTYENIVKAYPNSEKADEHLYNLGMAYAHNVKKYYKAIETWEELIETHPESRLITNTKFMIGYCYANDIKDLDKAREEYEKFLQEYPDHELVDSVNWELEHLGQDISDIDLQLGDDAESTTK
ncbi:outer membrane protein assembly factor BamD [candidate division KSB1 bacterium]|nr:tetratricopeptide repeat protein [candidate division KSB1 bacterium]RQW00577.1 MAG: outer membrane protein assembly factor BamD [candidate division KSB1 bacterium]